MVKCLYLCTCNAHINAHIQWNQTCVLYNDYLMYTFVHMHGVTNLDPLNSAIYVSLSGTEMWTFHH